MPCLVTIFFLSQKETRLGVKLKNTLKFCCMEKPLPWLPCLRWKNIIAKLIYFKAILEALPTYIYINYQRHKRTFVLLSILISKRNIDGEPNTLEPLKLFWNRFFNVFWYTKIVKLFISYIPINFHAIQFIYKNWWKLIDVVMVNTFKVKGDLDIQ